MTVRVDPQAIRTLAGAFRTTADALGRETAAFSDQAHLHPNAFGTLPAGRQAYTDYMERLQLGTGSLEQLRATLLQFADNLETTAFNWEQADRGSTAG